VVVAEADRLAQCELEHLLRQGSKRDLAGDGRLTNSDGAYHFAPHPLDRDVERTERARGDAFPLAHEADQDVLGPDVVVLEAVRFFVSQDHDVTGSLCESLEQGQRMALP